MKGRPKTSAESKAARGNPGKRPLNSREPHPAHDITPDPPTDLDAEGQSEWRRLSRELAGQGLLTDWDWGAFRIYCRAYATILRMERRIDKEGDIYVGPNGAQCVNAAHKILDVATRQLHAAADRLGLNPTARCRLSVTKAKEAQGESDEATNDIGF